MIKKVLSPIFVLCLAGIALAQPATVGTLDLGAADPSIDALVGHAADTVSWWEVILPSDGIFGVETCGSTFDTELGLYDASGALLGNNDDFCGLQSGLSGTLTAGSYFAAVSGFNTEFAGDFAVTPGAAAGDIAISAFTVMPPDPPATDGVFDLTATTMAMDTQTIGAEQVLWYEINHPGGELTLTTGFPETNILGTFNDLPDTELGLFDDLGMLLAENDDEDFANGIQTSLIVGDFPAGTYFAAMGAFATTFADGFGATSINPNSGDIKFAASVVPAPSSALLLALSTFGLFVIRRKR